mmetsp:Transcript_61188/g.146175  ORF Transcript_61188/g.146175 Transcript_61188/m.146175 type:complete len:255 (+) Transcript_61188:19-783(+)
MPRMVTTARMVEAMRTVLGDQSISQEDRDLLERYGPTAEWYPMDVVELLRRKLPAPPYLHVLLEGSGVAPPDPLPVKKRNPEMEARLLRIRAELEEREYEELTKDIRKEEFAHRDAGEMVTMSNSLGEGVNILVTKGTFFAVGYFASVAAWGREPVTNIGAGLAGLTFGFFMETTLFVLRSSSSIAETDRRKKQRKQKARGISNIASKASERGIPPEFLEAAQAADAAAGSASASESTPVSSEPSGASPVCSSP